MEFIPHGLLRGRSLKTQLLHHHIAESNDPLLFGEPFPGLDKDRQAASDADWRAVRTISNHFYSL